MLLAGVFLKSYERASHKDDGRSPTPGAESAEDKEGSGVYLFYVGLTLLSCVLSAFANVVNEKLLKQAALETDLQNVCLYAFGLLCCLGGACVPDDREGGVVPIFEIFSWERWEAILLDPVVMLSALLFAVLGVVTAYFLKHMHSIMKEVSGVVMVLLQALSDLVLFGYPLTPKGLAALMLVMTGMYFYSKAPVEVPKSGSEPASADGQGAPPEMAG